MLKESVLCNVLYITIWVALNASANQHQKCTDGDETEAQKHQQHGNIAPYSTAKHIGYALFQLNDTFTDTKHEKITATSNLISIQASTSSTSNETVLSRKKRSPGYSRSYKIKNSYTAPHGRSYGPHSYGGGYGGARAGPGRGYSAEPVYGGTAGFSQVSGAGNGYSGGYGGGGYGGGGYAGGYSAPPAYGYGVGGYGPGEYGAAPGGGGGGAGGGTPAGNGSGVGNDYMIDEKALAKYIEKLTRSSSRRRRRRSEESGSIEAKTRRRRRKRKEAKQSRRRRKDAKAGSRRRRKIKSRERRRRSSKSTASSGQEYSHEASVSYEQTRERPTPREHQSEAKMKPLAMSDVYNTPKPAYVEPLGWPPPQAQPQPQPQSSYSDSLWSSIFSSLLQSAVLNPLQPVTTTPPPTTKAPVRQQSQNHIAKELAKLGSLIKTTFGKMNSRLDNFKPSYKLTRNRPATNLRASVTPSPMENNFITSRSTSQWNRNSRFIRA